MQWKTLLILTLLAVLVFCYFTWKAQTMHLLNMPFAESLRSNSSYSVKTKANNVKSFTGAKYHDNAEKPKVSLLRLTTSYPFPMINILGNVTDHQEKKYELPSKDFAMFKRTLTDEDKAATKKLLAKFLQVANSSGVEYIMYGGTLLGSLRHHGMVPWDDDIDLWVSFTDREKLKKALGVLYPKYQYTEYSQRLKFYAKDGITIRGYRWTFPFIDISFYRHSIHFIYDVDPGFAMDFRYPVSWIFPLVKRPFWEFMMLAPGNSRAVIEKNYKLDLCQTNSYNHKLEMNVFKVVSLKCDLLREFIPFVYRKHQENGDVIEELKLGDEILSTYTYSTSEDRK